VTRNSSGSATCAECNKIIMLFKEVPKFDVFVRRTF